MLTEALPLPAVPGASPRWPFWGCGHHGEPLGESPLCLHIKPETPFCSLHLLMGTWEQNPACGARTGQEGEEGRGREVQPWGHAELLGVCSFPKPQDSSSPSEAAPWDSPYPAEMQI